MLTIEIIGVLALLVALVIYAMVRTQLQRGKLRLPGRAGPPTKILIVDDDPDFVGITNRILTKEGYRVASAASGEQAFGATKQQRPDLVLPDIVMASPLDGVDLSHRMASHPALKGIPIVAVSGIDGSVHAGLLPDDLHIPIDAWIRKPVKPDRPLRTVPRFPSFERDFSSEDSFTPGTQAEGRG